MTFADYQKFTESLATYNVNVYADIELPNDLDPTKTWVHEEPMHYIYPVLALAEEAGEVAGKVAKYVRKKGMDYTELRNMVKLELGDVMYQLSETARQFGWTLDQVVDANVDKLTDRKDRGVIIGEGDLR